MGDKKTIEKWITVKINAKVWWKIKELANKDKRKIGWYVEKGLEELINERNKKN